MGEIVGFRPSDKSIHRIKGDIMKFKKIIHIIKKLIIIGAIGLVSIFLVGASVNYIVVKSANKYIVNTAEETKDKAAQAIIVLGSYVHPDGTPSGILKDRLDTAIKVFNQNQNLKILVSGDHGRTNYDEVNVMREYLENKGVPTSQIFMDHAGFSTYETMYRAKEIFEIDKAIVVTQDYHLKRAVYLARKKGIEAYGVKADIYTYPGIKRFTAREVLARIKDFAFANILKPKPTYLGEKIPIMTSDSSLTHDRKDMGEK